MARVQRARARGGLRRRATRRSSGSSSPASRRATSTSSSWCAWPRSRTRSPRATPRPTWPASRRRSSCRAISERAHAMVEQLYAALTGEILPPLAERGLRLVRPGDLEPHRARRRSARFFKDEVLPALTPLAIDASRPFPMLASLSLNLAVLLGPAEGDDEPRLAVVQVPGAAAAAGAPAGRRGPGARAARGRDLGRPAEPLPGPGDPRRGGLPHRARLRARLRRRGRPRLPAGDRGGAQEPPPQRDRAARGRRTA